MPSGPALLVASGYVGALAGVTGRALEQLDTPAVRDDLPEELISALVDHAKSLSRLQKVLEANLDEAVRR